MARNPEMSSRFPCHLDQERHWNIDPEVFSNWFLLVEKTIMKYNIPIGNVFNMDEKKFLMGVAENIL